jgi:hypothetical protein
MPQVIVVPETNEFTHHVSHESVVWINANLGTPRLDARDVRYLAPYWITPGFRGTNRVYHITSVSQSAEGTTIIQLGNSFVTQGVWNEMGNARRFEYHELSGFGLEEIEHGLLRSVQPAAIANDPTPVD